MRIYVHLKDKVNLINCGEGAQTVKWLGDVAVFRYDECNGLETGMAQGMRLDNGNNLDMSSPINEIV